MYLIGRGKGGYRARHTWYAGKGQAGLFSQNCSIIIFSEIFFFEGLSVVVLVCCGVYLCVPVRERKAKKERPSGRKEGEQSNNAMQRLYECKFEFFKREEERKLQQ